MREESGGTVADDGAGASGPLVLERQKAPSAGRAMASWHR